MSAFTEDPRYGADVETRHQRDLDEPEEQNPARSPDQAQTLGWPACPLDAVQRAFELLSRPPAPLAFDCQGIGHLPQRPVALDELGRLLLADATPRASRDVVWAQLVTRARRDGPAWVVAVLGLALPGLRRQAGRLRPGWNGDSDDLDSELLVGFLQRLRTIDLQAPNICQRLIRAGARQVHRAREHGYETNAITGPTTAVSTPPAWPWDHPDLVLARAVASAVIGIEESILIGETRLDDVPLALVAERFGISAARAGAWRHKGELALVEAIRGGDLRWGHLPAPG
jgi:hypothetical protein